MILHRAALAGLAALLLWGCGEAAAPAERHGIRIDTVPAEVRLAITPAARRAGLKGVASLPADGGMLFVYPDDRRPRFWMQDCRIALDVAFAGADRRIHTITTLRPPTAAGGEIEAFEPRAATRYVLEMPAGFFARHGLGVGSRLHLGSEAAASAGRAE